MDGLLLAGASTLDLDFPPGLPMDGYSARVGTSTGAHDPLIAAALVLEYEDRRAAVVTLDVMAVSRHFTDSVRRDLAAVLRTSPDAVLICASHTHAAPSGLQDWTPVGTAALDHQLAESVHARIRLAVKRARDNLRPLRLRVAAGNVSGIGGDRNRPERTVDTTLSTLAFEGEDSEPAVILFHFACHPTVFGADNLAYSADFPGAARRRIRARYPNAECLFINGAAGNISTRFTRRSQSFDEVDRLGRILGDRAVELVSGASQAAPALNWRCESLVLPLRTFPLETRHVEASGNARIDVVRAQGAAIETQLRDGLQGNRSQQADVCAIQIGAWLLLTVPGEAFNDLAVTLRDVSPDALVVGYTNDYLGYFPTQIAIDDATYEALASAFDARAHALFQERLGALIRRVHSRP